MEVTRRELLKGAAALGAAGALSHALPGSAQAQTTQKKELVVAQGGDIARFDPHYSTSSNDIRWSFNIFDNLTSRHPDGKLYPGLATEWKLQGQTQWTFKLRQGVKFHNGDPFTSADAKFSLERTYDPNAKTMVATVFTTIDRIEALDPTTLVIHTKKPDPLLPDSAELKLLKSCQERINKTTIDYEKVHGPSRTSDPELRRQLQRLSEKQKEVADMARKMNERATGQ